MTTRIVKILTEKLVVGQYGSPVLLEIVDEDGVAADVAAAIYPTIIVVSTSPDRQSTLEWTGSGDSSGNLTFTPASSNTWDRPGTWLGQIEFSDSTSLLVMTPPFDMLVYSRLGS